MVSSRLRQGVAVAAAAAAMLLGAAGGASGDDAQASNLGARLAAGQSLTRGQTLTSPGGQFQLQIVDQRGVKLPKVYSRTCGWQSSPTLTSTRPSTAGELRMTPDGELTLVQDGQVTWSSRTGGNPGAHAQLQADGALVVRSAAGARLWSSERDFACTWMDTGQEGWWWVDTAQSRSQVLLAGDRLVSPGGRFRLDMQGDGNLVLYEGSKALWHTRTHGNPGAHVNLQTDGNLVLYSAANRPLWSTRTIWRAGTGQEHWLYLQDDGNLVLYWTALDADDYFARWSTRTAR